ncbi:hypothetical protein GCM10010522_65390 [Kribbella solani]
MTHVRRFDRRTAQRGGQEQLLDIHRAERHFRNGLGRCHVAQWDAVDSTVGVPDTQGVVVAGGQDADQIGQPTRNPVPDDNTVADITGTKA